MAIEYSNILLVGLLLLAGLFLGQIAARLSLPRVVAYVQVGVMFSPDLLGRYFAIASYQWSQPITQTALAIIAFIIGGSITAAQLQRIGRSILGIALGESLGAAIIVFLAFWMLAPALDGVPLFSIALVFAAISTTTAPAGTIAVLHQYRAKGLLTNTLLGVVALDDALGIILFALAMAVLTGGSIEYGLELALVDIGLALSVGSVLGLLLARLATYIQQKDLLLALTLGTILVTTGLAETFHFSILLSAMALGFSSRQFVFSAGDKLFGSIDFLEETVFLMFFTLAGTHFHIQVFLQHLDIILLYFFARVIGKLLGAAIGGRVSGSEPEVVRWLGLTLIPQAGVAVGLALSLSHRQGFEEISGVIVNVIIATTLVYEFIGPLAARFALKRAGELFEPETDKTNNKI